MTRRILHIGDSLALTSVADQLAAVATQLNNEEFETHVALLTHEPPLLTALAAANISSIEVSSRFAFDPAAWWRLRRYIARLGPGVVHTWTPRANLLGRSAALAAGVSNVVASRRNVEPNQSVLKTGIERLFDARTTAIVANSLAVERFCRDRGVAVGKLRVIYSGVALPAAAETTRQQVLAELGLPHDSRLIGTIGSLTRAKRIKDLIWSADLLKVLRQDVYLLIIGDGPHRAVLERYRRLCDIEDHVHFLGSRNDANALLPHLDVYWLASSREGLSGGLMRAMACGVPVVVSDIASNRELVVHGQTGFLVPTGDRANLARCARNILDDPELARRLGQAGQARMAAEFSLAAMVERHAALYRELCG